MIHAATPPDPRALTPRRQARVNEILDAALQIVEEDGIDGLTIQRLAKRMDWSVGALYRYYRGKDALLVDMQRRVLGVLGRALAAARESAPLGAPAAGQTPVAALAAVLRVVGAFRRFSVEEPSAFALISIFVGDPRVLLQAEEAAQVGDAMRPLLVTTAGTLEAAVSHGGLTPGDTTDRTLVLWAALHGLTQLGKLDRIEPRFSRRSDRLARVLTDGLLLGWGADPDNLHAARAAATPAQEGQDA